ncbi:rhodanese-like domain-containing protein [Herbaspirillum seropedicae]|uniref:rhodanese-like domain-containing protein n=1 Tax=Herbaspirillum seropedicae TaxID=964 RepID=UPI003D977282
MKRLPLCMLFAALTLLSYSGVSAQNNGYADELVDFGISPIDFPRSRSLGYGAPTPVSIPGAKVITTNQLMEMRKADPKPALFVVYNAKSVIPGSIEVNGAGEDRLLGPDLDRFTKVLAAETGGDKSKPVIFYCHGPKCWLSYNAALHAKEAGYTNVYWYRGGRDAWKSAGKPFKKAKTEDAQADD